jgi:hypothetical protein
MAKLCAGLNGGPLRNIEDFSSLAKEVGWALRMLENQQQRLTSLLPGFPSPVSSLPPELLALVFRFAIQSTSKDPVPKTPLSMSFAQVCRGWRSVALSLPSLWDTPLFNWPGFAKLMLQRSRDKPLIIEASLHDRTSRQVKQGRIMLALGAAWQELSHIRRLELCGPENAIDDWISRLPLYTTACQLKELSMSFDKDDRLVRERSTNRLCYHFLLGTWPGDDSDMSVRIGPALCTYLTELTLTNRGQVYTSLSDLLDILAQAHLLRNLTLGDVYDEDQFDSSSLPSRTWPRLEHLRKVSLAGSLASSVTLLECVSFREDAFIDLIDGLNYASHAYYSEPEDIVQAFTFLGAYTLRLQDLPHIGALYVKLCECRLEVYTEIDEITVYKICGQWLERDGDFGEDILPALARTLLLECTRQLTVSLNHDAQQPHSSAWGGVFRYMNHLQSITLERQAGFGFLAALHTAHCGTASLPLAGLNKLVLSCINMDLPVEDDSEDELVATAMEVLTEILLKRTGGGQMHTVLSVFLEDCRFEENAERERQIQACSAYVQVRVTYTDMDGAWDWDGNVGL